MPRRIDYNASSNDRLRRNMQKLGKGDLTETIHVTAPLTNNGTALGLSFAASTGLGLAANNLAILFSDASIAGSSTGIHVVESSTGGISTSALGIGLKLADSSLILSASGVQVSFANPSATVGLATINGSAVTAMRSDAAPAINQSITPTWTGVHTWQNRLFNSASGAIVFLFNSAGSDFGTLQNDGPNAWSFGHTNVNSQSLGTPVFKWNSSNQVTIPNGTFQVTNSGQFGRLLANPAFGSPTLHLNTGAGTGATASFTGNELAGKITVNTGTGPTTNDDIIDFQFVAGNNFASPPSVVLTPGNLAAGAVPGIWVFTNAGSFSIESGATALTPSTTYIWNYLVVGT